MHRRVVLEWVQMRLFDILETEECKNPAHGTGCTDSVSVTEVWVHEREVYLAMLKADGARWPRRVCRYSCSCT